MATSGEHELDDANRLARWERRTMPIITTAAILPLAVGLTRRHADHPAVVLDVASWLVFVVDYAVHLRLKPKFARSRVGAFDLVIVVVTAPLYLVVGTGAGHYLAIGRIARLGRVLVVSGHSRKLRDLGRRLGQAALYGIALIVVCALVVEAAEPASSGFDHFSDALWWAIVTFTTVGYGDLYPVTGVGRFSAVLLMLGGIALIGSLAASLGSFFQKDEETEDEFRQVESMQRELLAEVRELRAEIAALRAATPPAGDDSGR